MLSLEEVEGGLKGLKVESDQPQTQPPRAGCGTPFMAEQLEQALTGGQPRVSRSRDSDMSAFNKLVSSMKASGTLPNQPNVSVTLPVQLRPHLALVACPHASSRASPPSSALLMPRLPSVIKIPCHYASAADEPIGFSRKLDGHKFVLLALSVWVFCFCFFPLFSFLPLVCLPSCL